MGNQFSFVFFIFLVLCFGILFFLKRKQAETLKSVIKEKEKGLESTSRLLIEKNLELFDQNVRLQKLLEAKTDFVGIASHQLRTPVTEIKWGLDVLLEEWSRLPDQKRLDDLENIRESTVKMVHLIDELLRLVHAEGGYREYQIEPCNLEESIRTVTNQAKAHFAGKVIKVAYDFEFGNKPVGVDAEMMEAVFSNLIFNAFHYTPSEGSVKISTREQGGKFFFEIRDNGIGIPENKKDTMFQKFHRAKTAMEMNSGGMGLGLYIAKNIVEQHKGEIGFSSTEGKGSTFYFSIPVNS